MNDISKKNFGDVSIIPLPLSDDNKTIDEDRLERIIVESLDHCLRYNCDNK